MALTGSKLWQHARARAFSVVPVQSHSISCTDTGVLSRGEVALAGALTTIAKTARWPACSLRRKEMR